VREESGLPLGNEPAVALRSRLMVSASLVVAGPLRSDGPAQGIQSLFRLTIRRLRGPVLRELQDDAPSTLNELPCDQEEPVPDPLPHPLLLALG